MENFVKVTIIPLPMKKRDTIDVTNILFNNIQRAAKPAPEYGLANNISCRVDQTELMRQTTAPSILRSRAKTSVEEEEDLDSSAAASTITNDATPAAQTLEEKGLDALVLGDLVVSLCFPPHIFAQCKRRCHFKVVGTLGRGAYAHVQLVTETVSKPDGSVTVHALKTGILIQRLFPGKRERRGGCETHLSSEQDAVV